jgi:hypothetical protein
MRAQFQRGSAILAEKFPQERFLITERTLSEMRETANAALGMAL